MKKVTYEQWLTKFIENLQEYFNLSGWNIFVKFSDETKSGSGAYAENEINSSYQWSVITFYAKSKEEFLEGELDYLIQATVHEMVHIFLDPFQEYMHPHLSMTTTPLFMDMLEQQTQKLTMVFLKSLPKKLIPPR